MGRVDWRVLACLSSVCLGGCGDHDWQDELGHVGGAGAAGGRSSVADPVLPCAVQATLEAKCRRCHTEPPQNGAPFPLLSWGDTQREYVGKPIYERMLTAIETGLMPPTGLPLDPPVVALGAEEKQTLVDWLEAGAAPEDGVGCP